MENQNVDEMYLNERIESMGTQVQEPNEAMSEKSSGKEKYTPTCLEWLVVMLNSTFHFYDINRDGFELVYLPAEDGESIQMMVTHYANVNGARMSKAVEAGQRIARSLAKSYKWDSWVSIKVDFREIG